MHCIAHMTHIRGFMQLHTYPMENEGMQLSIDKTVLYNALIKHPNQLYPRFSLEEPLVRRVSQRFKNRKKL